MTGTGQRKRMNATKQADKLFSEIIRGQAHGLCWAAGYRFDCSAGLQCCHVISRRYRSIRWDPENAVAMCGAHHTYFTHHPLEWEVFCRDDIERDVDELKLRALNDPPEKAADALARLRALTEGTARGANP